MLSQDLGDKCGGTTNILKSETATITLNFTPEDLNPPVFDETFYTSNIVENLETVTFNLLLSWIYYLQFNFCKMIISIISKISELSKNI